MNGNGTMPSPSGEILAESDRPGLQASNTAVAREQLFPFFQKTTYSIPV